MRGDSVGCNRVGGWRLIHDRRGSRKAAGRAIGAPANACGVVPCGLHAHGYKLRARRIDSDKAEVDEHVDRMVCAPRSDIAASAVNVEDFPGHEAVGHEQNDSLGHIVFVPILPTGSVAEAHSEPGSR